MFCLCAELAAARAGLANTNVRFFDATHVFDRQQATMYMDNCCHYTLLGNRVLAEFIGASILAAPGPWSAARN